MGSPQADPRTSEIMHAEEDTSMISQRSASSRCIALHAQPARLYTACGQAVQFRAALPLGPTSYKRCARSSPVCRCGRCPAGKLNSQHRRCPAQPSAPSPRQPSRPLRAAAPPPQRGQRAQRAVCQPASSLRACGGCRPPSFSLQRQRRRMRGVGAARSSCRDAAAAAMPATRRPATPRRLEAYTLRRGSRPCWMRHAMLPCCHAGSRKSSEVAPCTTGQPQAASRGGGGGAAAAAFVC